MDKEKLIAEILADMPDLTKEEAEEMAEMEIKAKSIAHYEQSEKKAEKKPRTKKVDEEKAKILEIINKVLTDNGYNAIITNVDKEITFNDFSVTLTRHRAKKG